MKNRNDRISDKLRKDMRNIARTRIQKNLADPLKRSEISMREMTELLTKTEAYHKALEELRVKPKRK